MLGRAFQPTDIGKIVSKFLVKYLGTYVDYGFTALMEDALDEISNGEKEWHREQDGFHGTEFPGGRRRVGGLTGYRNILWSACKALTTDILRFKMRAIHVLTNPVLHNGSARHLAADNSEVIG